MGKLKICLFESYYGGSHKSFADGFINNTDHDVKMYSLPELSYKWRMRGAALYLIEKGYDKNCDILFVSDMFNVADYKALRGNKAKPVVTYFHENQITYPANSPQNDFGLGMINIVSALASDLNIFNSKTHMDQFINAIPEFLERAPDYYPDWIVDSIKEKCRVLYPGCNFDDKYERTPFNKIPLIIWNHRWDYDKKPGTFFFLLKSLKEIGIDFKVALLGQNYSNKTELFENAERDFKDNIVFSGFAKRDEYVEWLKKGDIVISTAIQENFGYSVVEAIHYRCVPLLPERLSYPEIIPEKYHGDILYGMRKELIVMTCDTIKNINKRDKMADELSDSMKKFSWKNQKTEYDRIFEEVYYENRVR